VIETPEQMRDVVMDALNGKRLSDEFQRSIESDVSPIDGEPACGVMVNGHEFFIVVEEA
jgi:hypothetical protein